MNGETPSDAKLVRAVRAQIVEAPIRHPGGASATRASMMFLNLPKPWIGHGRRWSKTRSRRR